MAWKGRPTKENKFGDGPNLEFFTGLYEGTGKVLFRAVLDSARAKEALKNAIKATNVEGKISIVIIEASKGEADAWAAFSGMPDPDDAPKKSSSIKKTWVAKGKQKTTEKEEEADTDIEPVEASAEEDWD